MNNNPVPSVAERLRRLVASRKVIVRQVPPSGGSRRWLVVAVGA